MAKRKRATRAASLVLPPAKPRNAALQAAANGRIKLGTRSHAKSQAANRRLDKVALQQQLRRSEQD
jgi:hypothetical protein